MEQVNTLSIENRNSPQEFSELLNNILLTATFDVDRVGKCTPSQFRQLYYSGKNLDPTAAYYARSLVDEKLLATLTERLRSVLSGHLFPGEDTLPNKLVPLMGGVDRFAMPEFADRLIQSTAILGTTRATQMLFQWTEGKPIRYWRHTVLDGVSVEQPLELNGAIRIANLPNSSDEIPRYIPSSLRFFHYNALTYVGLAKLSTEYETTFLSRLPPKEDTFIEHKHASIGIGDFSIDEFCETLALVCNHYVSWLASWSDCGDWNMFSTMSGGTTRHIVPNISKVKLSPGQLMQACKLFALRQSRRTAAKRLNIAIARWIRSKRGDATLADKFIDLRIALEALYLAEASGESRFRVSNYGAWHLGENFSDRHAHHKILRDTYDFASKVVHAGEVEYAEASLKLLTAAQDLCRKGILKRLEESEEPNWNEMILGREN